MGEKIKIKIEKQLGFLLRHFQDFGAEEQEGNCAIL